MTPVRKVRYQVGAKVRHVSYVPYLPQRYLQKNFHMTFSSFGGTAYPFMCACVYDSYRSSPRD
jgi:hypothetical protein